MYNEFNRYLYLLCGCLYSLLNYLQTTPKHEYTGAYIHDVKLITLYSGIVIIHSPTNSSIAIHSNCHTFGLFWAEILFPISNAYENMTVAFLRSACNF